MENKEPKYQRDSSFIQSFLSSCINMDEWNHSWHMDVSNGQIRGSKERKEIRKILLDKIKARESQIQELKDAVQVLGRWHY